MEPVMETTADPATDPASEQAQAATPAPPPTTAVASAESGDSAISLYNNVGTTFVAVLLGIFIVAGIQVTVMRIFARERNEHRALTQFVTSMVAIMVGVYVSDMLIAGPHVELLAESERTAILSFVKDTALMIFAYYFGTKATSNAE